MSGQFNGNVTTACSYDPYTANATRSVTDLVVAGGVGSYPLAFTRTMNSQSLNYYVPSVGNRPAFGAAGTWTHSYQWTIDPASVVGPVGVWASPNYFVNYPDGRRIMFSNSSSDPDFRGPLGIRDRFIPLTSGGTECYLQLPDGGKVWFHATSSTTVNGNVQTTTYTFTCKGIIDPYGQTTTITYPSDGSLTVTEPAGRTIKVFYKTGPAGDTVVDHINGSDGRIVTYNYGTYTTANGTHYSALTSVRYFGDPTLDATYTYQASNVDPNGRPLIATCIDTMYDGPMWKIAYDFQPAGTNADGSRVMYGQLFREKHLNGTVVSTLTVNAKTSQGYNSRTETRGDGPARTFTYTGYLLNSVTDFKNVAATQGYDGNDYLASVTDRNGNTTTFTANSINGGIKQVVYPTSSDVTPQVHPTLNYDYGGNTCPDPNNQDQYNKYWLFQGPDGKQYYRDSHKQVTDLYDTWYDSSGQWFPVHTSFTYNGFGQVLTRTYSYQSESYTYDSAGKVTAYYDYLHPTTGHPTVWYQYDSYGRVSGMTEARGSTSGDPSYSTTFQYNARGQLTRLTHPDGTYIQYGYNAEGTLAWTADERHPGASTDANQRTSYTYDDYKRLLMVTTPQRGSGDSTPRTTTYNYDPSGSGAGYTRTAAAPIKVTSPGGKVVNTAYDQNLRTTSVTAVGDANVSSATTSYTYDANGNALTVKDPNGQSTGAVTQYGYDKQNRVQYIIDPISADRSSSGHSVDFTYETNGQVAYQQRADGAYITNFYWPNGQLYQRNGYNGEVTYYNYGFDGHGEMLLTGYSFRKVDNTLITYQYGYDNLGRPTYVTYPADVSGAVRTENYHYDIGNHLDQYTNPAGQVKSLIYDNRGRLTNTSWSANGPSVTIGYDATRPTSIISSQSGTTATIGFGYDEANNRIYEDQTITGLATRRVQADPDADGNRTDLLVKTGTTVNFANYFDYTNRNELLNIYDSSHAAFFKYSYDASGNVTQRLGQRLHDSTVFTYDALNRPITCAQNGLNASNFATSHYDYDKLGNLQDTYRDEEGGKGERFGYDGLNQLATAYYSATNVTSGTPQNPAKTVSYSVGARNRRSMTVTDNILNTTTTTTYTNIDLNQISSIQVGSNPAQSLAWDGNLNLSSYNGWSYSYDAENRLISVSGNGHSASFVYDGVGRCVKRVLDGVTTLFTYDQWTPIAEWDGSGNLIATNVYGLGDDEIMYRSAGSTQLFYKSDPMGNVKFLLDQTGTGIEKYKYDAFGQPTITDWSGNARTSSAYGNRFMFSGRDYMNSLALYDMRNRVYDPVMGRFYQTDPIGFQGDPLNLYRFSRHNPLLGGDPTGLDDTGDTSDCCSSDTGSSDTAPTDTTTFEFSISGPSSIDLSGSDSTTSGFTFDYSGDSSYAFSSNDNIVYLSGIGGATYPVPVKASLVGTFSPGGQTALDRAVRTALDSISSFIEWLGFNRSDLDAIAMLPVAAPVRGVVAVEELAAGSRLASEIRVAATGKELADAATRAGSTVGAGRGALYGTRVHSAFRAEVNALQLSNIRTEVSYMNGLQVPYGTAGSVRLDAVEFDVNGKILQIFDLKTGGATLTPQRIQQIQQQTMMPVPVNLLRP